MGDTTQLLLYNKAMEKGNRMNDSFLLFIVKQTDFRSVSIRLIGCFKNHR
jgi:hypothetical protein